MITLSASASRHSYDNMGTTHLWRPHRWGRGGVQPEVDAYGRGRGQSHYDVHSKNIFSNTIAFYKAVH